MTFTIGDLHLRSHLLAVVLPFLKRILNSTKHSTKVYSPKGGRSGPLVLMFAVKKLDINGSICAMIFLAIVRKIQHL
jgi:hypothetical protein